MAIPKKLDQAYIEKLKTKTEEAQLAFDTKIFKSVADKEEARADEIAKLVVDYTTNEDGQELANVQSSQAFQEIYDYKGGEKKRWRLDRKKEQICRNYRENSHLFQKVYYSHNLLLDDERQLR